MGAAVLRSGELPGLQFDEHRIIDANFAKRTGNRIQIGAMPSVVSCIRPSMRSLR